MEKIDPYKHKEKYLGWKERAQSDMSVLSTENASLLIRHITDMETGLNVSIKHKKGSRSYLRLNTIRTLE